jgi:hypothetical protein
VLCQSYSTGRVATRVMLCHVERTCKLVDKFFFRGHVPTTCRRCRCKRSRFALACAVMGCSPSKPPEPALVSNRRSTVPETIVMVTFADGSDEEVSASKARDAHYEAGKLYLKRQEHERALEEFDLCRRMLETEFMRAGKLKPWLTESPTRSPTGSSRNLMRRRSSEKEWDTKNTGYRNLDELISVCEIETTSLKPPSAVWSEVPPRTSELARQGSFAPLSREPSRSRMPSPRDSRPEPPSWAMGGGGGGARESRGDRRTSLDVERHAVLKDALADDEFHVFIGYRQVHTYLDLT